MQIALSLKMKEFVKKDVKVFAFFQQGILPDGVTNC